MFLLRAHGAGTDSSSQAVALGRDGWRRSGRGRGEGWHRMGGKCRICPRREERRLGPVCQLLQARVEREQAIRARTPKNSCFLRDSCEEWLSYQAFPAFHASETWRVVPDPDRPKGSSSVLPRGASNGTIAPRGERVSAGSRPRFPVAG